MRTAQVENRLFQPRPHRPSIGALICESLGGHFSEHQLRVLMRVGLFREIRTGGRLVVPDAAQAKAIAVVAGRVDLMLNGHLLAAAGPGDIVGTPLMVSWEAEQTTVAARTAVAMFGLSARSMATLLGECPSLAGRVRQLTMDGSLERGVVAAV